MAFLKNYPTRLKILFLFIVCVQLYHAIQYRQQKVTNFNCEICADKSGYYIYLPLWFNYGLDTANIPGLVQERTRESFKNELAPGKSFTKFSAGVAMLLSPFYAVANFRHQVFGRVHPNPISADYLRFTNFGTALYLTLAFLCLFLLLRKRFGDGPALLTILFLYFGTALRYYTEDESLMSHVYSFCLFTWSWFFLEKALLTRKRTALILFAVFASWAVLIRPTNIIGIPVILSLAIKPNEWKTEFSFLLKSLHWMLLPAFLIWIPQLVYWKMTTGDWLVYSYQNEGFHRWKNPALSEQWFAVNSGILAYTPAFILVPLGLAGLLWKQGKQYAPLFISFLLCIYLFAAWWAKGYGTCNFGYRPLVEFTALWSMGIAWAISALINLRSSLKLIVTGFLLICITYTNYLYWRFESCFSGGDWDFARFFRDYFN
ncbi:MAG: hypothetical protein ACYC1Q_01955 [Bacteroidia bacterium]